MARELSAMARATSPHFPVSPQTNHTDKFAAQYQLEERRFLESARQARVLILLLLPLGAVLGMVNQYLSILEQLDNADYYYILDRVDTGVYLRLVAPALLGGIISAVAVTAAFSFVADAGSALWQLIVIGLLYGVLMPTLAGFLMPLNLFLLSVIGVSRVSGQGGIQSQIGDLIFSTPAHTYLALLFNIGPGMVSGLFMAGVAWVLLRVAGPLADPAKAPWLVLAGFGVGVVIMAGVMAGPFSITGFLFNWYPNQ